MYVSVFRDQSSTPECRRSQVAARILAFDPGGPARDAAGAPISFDFPVCSIGQARATPDGGGVVGLWGAESAERLLHLDATLRETWSYVPQASTVRRFVASIHAIVDGGGRTVLVRSYRHSGSGRDGVQLTLLGPDGRAGVPVYTDEIDPDAGFAGLAHGQSAVAVAADRVYLIGTKCPAVGGCPHLTAVAYAVSMPGLVMDYPRSAVLGGPVPPPAARCGDAVVLAARGSGDNDNGTNHPGHHALAIVKQLRGEHRLTLYDDTRPGDDVIGVDYPAVRVGLESVFYPGSM